MSSAEVRVGPVRSSGRRASTPRSPDAGPSFEIVESKLRPMAPRLRISRRALLEQLRSSDRPITTVIAPAGYGKTSLLAQWDEQQPHRLAWLSTDDADNDPAVLCTYLAVALDRIEPVCAPVYEALAAHRPASTLLARLLAAIEAFHEPVTLVVDHLEGVTSTESLDVIAGLAVRLPPPSRLVLCSREQIRLPTPRMRVAGHLLELGPRDLAFGHEEAAELLRSAGLDLVDADVDTLVEHTEGWPAGLYLTALSMRAGSSRLTRTATPTGDSRLLADYLRAEILEHASAEEVAFVTRTSILETMHGALCDATLGRTGSAATLEELEGRNLLVVPLDDRREVYRYHQLFRELLRGELQRREPHLVADLHVRAAEWYETNAQPERALHHAQVARDADRVARLLLDLVQSTWASGRTSTVMQWLEWVADENLAGAYPALAVHGALMYALVGRPADAEMWSAMAHRSLVLTDLADGSSMESLLAYLRSFLCCDGVAAMKADAISSYAGLSPTSPYRASMLYAQGLAHLIGGEPELAGPTLVRASDAADAIGATPVAASVLAARALLAIDRDDWAEATALGERALSLLDDRTFDEYWTSALVFACGARIALRAGQVDAARTHLAHSARLRPLLTYALPVVSVMTLVEMARTYVALADPAGAEAVLGQARDILEQRPDLGVLGEQVERLRAQLEALAPALDGASALTPAELRLLPLLATHLSLQEIGERLFIARSTVKTHAVSIYRKLGVSSRSEAIDKLHELGLLIA
jgi:LuxR family transcriptional regulator, maltose regulon positive regulatory protein